MDMNTMCNVEAVTGLLGSAILYQPFCGLQVRLEQQAALGSQASQVTWLSSHAYT